MDLEVYQVGHTGGGLRRATGGGAGLKYGAEKKKAMHQTCGIVNLKLLLDKPIKLG